MGVPCCPTVVYLFMIIRSTTLAGIQEEIGRGEHRLAAYRTVLAEKEVLLPAPLPVRHVAVFIGYKGSKDGFKRAIENLLYDRLKDRVKRFYRKPD